MRRLPVLLSIPHGGKKVPTELQNRICISRHDLFDDIDPFTQEIYNLGRKAVEVVKTDIARTFVDLNRAPEDLPPQNPDGVIKSMTCFQRPIYQAGKEPDKKLIKQLLRIYYEPYHKRLKKAKRRQDIELVLDCHSMLAVGPPISPDEGKPRPMICLGNANGITCSKNMIEELAGGFRKAFSLKDSDVTINKPFSGGYITRKHGAGSIPMVQVEMSRALYLDPKWFDRQTMQIDQSRLQALQKMFEMALWDFFKS